MDKPQGNSQWLKLMLFMAGLTFIIEAHHGASVFWMIVGYALLGAWHAWVVY